MDGLWQVIVIVLVVVIVYANRSYLARRENRLALDHIREHMARHGGTVLAVASGAGWLPTRGLRLYDVSYTLSGGGTVNATCLTSASGEVYWLGSAPPALAEDRRAPEMLAAPGPSLEEIHRTLSVPAEPVACLSCGTNIPSQESRCPVCGWSYQEQ